MTKKEELEAQGYKTYENEDIQVFWKPRICQHVGECARGNYNVFNPQRRPWVDVSQAPAAEIADIIDRCPSKALQYELKDRVTIRFSETDHASLAYVGRELIGECIYLDATTKWTIAHTSVEPEFEGKGIAKRLVLRIIEEARVRKIRIIPRCPYARRLMTGKEEFKDVI